MINIRSATDKDIESIIAFFDKYTSQLGAFVPDERVYVTITGRKKDGTNVQDKFGSLKDLNNYKWGLAFDDEKLIGVGLAFRKKLYNLVVDKEYRNKGVGTLLLKHLNPELIRCKINTPAGNPQQFYEKNGYTPLGVIKSHFGNWCILLMSNRQKPLFSYDS